MRANTLTLLLSLTILTSPQVLAKKNLGSHEHGSAKISLSYENNAAEIELEAPADSIIGFEHAPKTDKEKKAFENAKGLWQNLLSDLVVFPKELNCKITESEFKQELSDDKHEKNSHSEIEASATITCEKNITGDIAVMFRKQFKKMKNVKLEVVGTKSMSLKLKNDNEIIKL